MIRSRPLGVKSQHVVPRGERAEGRTCAETGVRPCAVVMLQPAGQQGRSLSGVVERARIGPFAEGGLDKPFRLAIGARGIGPGTPVGQAELDTGAAEAVRDIAR